MSRARVAQSEAQFRADGKGVYSQWFMETTGIPHVSTTRDFSTALPQETSRVDEMRSASALIGMPDACLALGDQRHTCNVAEVVESKPAPGQHQLFPQTDAIITSEPGVVLAIQTADCTPIFLADPVARVIGLVHAGWRGTYSRIAEKTVAKMEKAGASRQSIRAWIGPVACVCCYEVSTELIDAFEREFSYMEPSEIHEGRHLNLLHINFAQLERSGVSTDNIRVSEICTIHQNDQFYSYRGDNGTSGRIISAMGMTEG